MFLFKDHQAYMLLCEAKPNEMGRPEAISYSGPTYIAIRSGKHFSSNATSHAQDLDTIYTVVSFIKFMKNEYVQVSLFSLYRATEVPRYCKVIAHAIEHFNRKQHAIEHFNIFQA